MEPLQGELPLDVFFDLGEQDAAKAPARPPARPLPQARLRERRRRRRGPASGREALTRGAGRGAQLKGLVTGDRVAFSLEHGPRRLLRAYEVRRRSLRTTRA